MRRIKIIFMVVLALILCTSTLAIDEYDCALDPNNLEPTLCFNLNNNCDEQILGASCTAVANYTDSETPFDSGYSYQSNATTKYIDTNFHQFKGQGNMSICLWMKILQIEDSDSFGGRTGGPDNKNWDFWFYSADGGVHQWRMGNRDEVDLPDSFYSSFSNGEWQHLCIIHSEGSGVNKIRIVWNGTDVPLNSNNNELAGADEFTQDLYIGCKNVNGVAEGCIDNVYIDQIIISNTTNWSTSDANTIYTYVSGAAAIDVNISTPLNYSKWGLSNVTNNLYINGTHNSLSTTVCAINDTQFSSATATAPSNFSFVNNTLLADGNYTLKVQCNRTGTDNGSATVLFTLDLASPVIDMESDLKSGFKFIEDDNFTININFSDNREIYSINITLGNGTVLFNATNMGITEYQANISILMDGRSISNGTARICDSSTLNLIKSIPFDYESTGIKYIVDSEINQPQKYIKVYPKNTANYKPAYTYKNKDRYNFMFNKKTSFSEWETFIVESTHKIDIAKRQIKGGHLVIKDLGDNGYWIDFKTGAKQEYQFNRISDYVVEVKVKGLSGSSIEFKSIGELNCVQENFFFSTANYYYLYNVSGGHYTRNVTYSFNITCPTTEDVNVQMFINGSHYRNDTVVCTNNSYLYSSNYTHNKEGEYNLSFLFNNSGQHKANQTIQSDLYDPEVKLNITIEDGFANFSINISMYCNDTIQPTLYYNFSFNGTVYFDKNHSRDLLIHNDTLGYSGTNQLIGVCSDYVSTTTQTFNKVVYTRTLILIDEIDNVLFNVSNITSARAYYDDNHTYFEFTERATVNFTSDEQSKLRIELKYPNNDIITRWLDVSLAENNNIRVCANKEGVTHYEQLIISSGEQEVTLRSIFANCVVAQDYTRFSYQNSFLIKAYTIQTLYSLLTVDDDGDRITLASMDGSVATYYNIDMLEFNKEGYDLNIGKESLVITTRNNNVNINYRNLDNDSVITNTTITRTDTDEIIYQYASTTSPNELNLVFDSTTLNLSRNLLLLLELETENEDGDTSTLSRYFTMGGRSSYISSQLAFGLAMLITLFGLTYTISRLEMGWFGILAVLASMAVLSLGALEWYSVFLMVLDTIICVFITLLLLNKNYETVA